MSAEDEILTEVRGLQAKRQTAMIEKDLDTLGSLLDKDSAYVHSTGRLMTKAEYLEHVASEEFACVSVKPLPEERYSVSERMVDSAAARIAS